MKKPLAHAQVVRVAEVCLWSWESAAGIEERDFFASTVQELTNDPTPRLLEQTWTEHSRIPARFATHDALCPSRLPLCSIQKANGPYLACA